LPQDTPSVVRSLLEELPRERTSLLPALLRAQDTEGWLSAETLAAVAEHLGIPADEVHTAARHFSEFRLARPGDHLVRICTGLSCRLMGSAAHLHALEARLQVTRGQTTPDGRVTLEGSECLSLCPLAPVLEVDGYCHGLLTPEHVDHLPIWFRRRQSLREVKASEFPQTGATGRTAEERLGQLQSAAKARAQNRPEWRFLVQGGSCGEALGAGDVVKALRLLTAMRGLPAEVLDGACHGRCSGGIVVEVQRPGWPWLTFTHLTKDEIPELLSWLANTALPLNRLQGFAWDEEDWHGLVRVSRHPFFSPQSRLLMERCGHLNPVSLDDALLAGSYAALARALDGQRPEELIAHLEEVGLSWPNRRLGARAGRWSPRGRMPGKPKYLVVNGAEGGSAELKDRHLIEGDPHLVLEGLLLAAYATGARRSVLYLQSGARRCIDRMTRAVAKAQAAGLVGAGILGSPFSFDVEIRRGVGRFPPGGETALLESIEGRVRARTESPPPQEPILWEEPAIVTSLETLAAVAAVSRRGRGRFVSAGPVGTKRTKLFGLSGPLNRPGVVEVEEGVALRRLLLDLAGGIRDGKVLGAVVVEGGRGIVVTPELLQAPIETAVFLSPGASGIVAVPEEEAVGVISGSNTS